MVFELFFYNVTIRSDYLDAENRLVLFTIYFLYQYKNSVYYIRFGFLRICRCKNWSHTSKLDPRHQSYRVDPIMGPSAHCRCRVVGVEGENRDSLALVNSKIKIFSWFFLQPFCFSVLVRLRNHLTFSYGRMRPRTCEEK